jgi:hypothetical protein
VSHYTKSKRSNLCMTQNCRAEYVDINSSLRSGGLILPTSCNEGFLSLVTYCHEKTSDNPVAKTCMTTLYKP